VTPVPSTRRLAISCLVALAALLVTVATSLGVGATGIDPLGALRTLVTGAPASALDLVVDVRMPRVLLTVLIGASLATAGLLAQTLTRNPLASPQTFGVNAGAAAAIVTTLVLFPSLGAFSVLAAFAGAAVVGVVMWALSAASSISTVGLALAGMTLQILLSAVVQAVLIMNNATQDLVFWLAGSVTGAQWEDVTLLLPFAVAGCLIALVGQRHFGLLALDAATGTALGQNTNRVAGLAAILVVVLAGASVSVAGPIGFVGLIVPHISARIVGSGFAHKLVFGLIGGPLLFAAADLVAKLVAFPKETPAGIVTALIGAPAFLVLALRQRTAR